ncbi:hypothetical protein A3C98_02215 [Candidatus Roizmanbacteria bacterium RIFCSPHIGHO2_02_FULL_37_15]|nr:MAG: hypothetical protein A3C98_02215 [Candidatus Roizmanbacteria bacterium RIFCSPHIGHO2_02_FULL_37_15]
MLKKIIGATLFTFVIFLFCYFRLKPLYFQTVGYTYDQGRDFLKAAEIILDKNITFIGPTTGIQGLFHGAWYYYLLLIPFIIFKASPIGFYYFNFFIQLLSFLFFAYFLKKFFGPLVALIISVIVSTSPYFIFTSTFIGNNIFVLPFFLAFLLVNFLLIEDKVNKFKLFLLISGLLVGFITEFELAFGLFLIPSYLLFIIFLKKLRSIYFQKKNFLFVLIGLIIPFIPRLLFELKNNFMQTRNFFIYLTSLNTQISRSFGQILQERVNLFYGYFNSLFLNDTALKVFLIFFILLIYFFSEFRIKKYYQSIHFFILLSALLFFLSSLSRTDFFWENYYEGIQYLILLILALALTIDIKINLFLFNFAKINLLIILLIISLNSILKDFKVKPNSFGTLKQLSQIIYFIHSNENKKSNYCVKVYTPPVIPYTYNYLFLYEKLSKNIPTPQSDWVNSKCWFIIEPDDNKERRAQWLNKNIPRLAKTAKETVIDDIEVVLFELN